MWMIANPPWEACLLCDGLESTLSFSKSVLKPLFYSGYEMRRSHYSGSDQVKSYKLTVYWPSYILRHCRWIILIATYNRQFRYSAFHRRPIQNCNFGDLTKSEISDNWCLWMFWVLAEDWTMWLWRQWLAGPWLSSKVSKSAKSWCLKESTSFESSEGHLWRKIHLWRVYSTLRGDRSYCQYKQSQFTKVIIYSGSQVVRQERLITIKGMCL